jgi:hypothetical protein
MEADIQMRDGRCSFLYTYIDNTHNKVVRFLRDVGNQYVAATLVIELYVTRQQQKSKYEGPVQPLITYLFDPWLVEKQRRTW